MIVSTLWSRCVQVHEAEESPRYNAETRNYLIVYHALLPRSRACINEVQGCAFGQVDLLRIQYGILNNKNKGEMILTQQLVRIKSSRVTRLESDVGAQSGMDHKKVIKFSVDPGMNFFFCKVFYDWVVERMTDILDILTQV